MLEKTYELDSTLLTQSTTYSIVQAIAIILVIIFIVWNIKMSFDNID